jgi:hypothetical protein
MSEPKKSDDSRVTWWQVVGSTLAAAIGVQKRANRERDFSRGRPIQFIIAGIVFTAVFVLIVVLVVRLVLSQAGG